MKKIISPASEYLCAENGGRFFYKHRIECGGSMCSDVARREVHGVLEAPPQRICKYFTIISFVQLRQIIVSHHWLKCLVLKTIGSH